MFGGIFMELTTDLNDDLFYMFNCVEFGPGRFEKGLAGYVYHLQRSYSSVILRNFFSGWNLLQTEQKADPKTDLENNEV